MADIAGSVVWNLDIDKSKFDAGLKQASSSIDTAGGKIEDKLSSIGSKTTAVGGALIGLGAPAALAFGIATKAALTFEDQLAGVAKTTGLTGEELDQFGKDILSYSQNTKTSADDLLVIAEVAGQLGVRKEDVTQFTKTIDKLNVALGKDFQGGAEEVATSFGKITGLFNEFNGVGLEQSLLGVGSVINYLGAEGAATSSNLTNFILRLGQLPNAIKPGVSEAGVIGALLEEAGLSAEIGAGGFSNILLVAGENLGSFADQLGVTTDEARDLLSTDPTQFVLDLAKSLNGLSPDKAALILKDLKIGTQESIKVLGALEGSQDRYNQLLAQSELELKKATSVIDEYNILNNTSQAGIDKTVNLFKSLSVIVGQDIIEAFGGILRTLQPVILAFASFVENNTRLVTIILAMGSAIVVLGGVLVVIGSVISAIATISGALTGLSGVIGIVSKVFAIFPAIIGFLVSPIGLVILAITALIAIGTALYFAYQNNWFGIRDIVNGVVTAVVGFVQQLWVAISENWRYILALTGSIDVFALFVINNWEKIKNMTVAAWQLISSFIAENWQKIVALSGPIGAFAVLIINNWAMIKSTTQSVFSSIVSTIQSAVSSVQNAFSSMVSSVSNYLSDLWNRANDYAGKIKDALSKISPFHKSSPSLVEYVQMGTMEIAGLYEDLSASISLPQISETGNELVENVSNKSVTINNNNNINNGIDMEAFSRSMSWQLRTV